MRWHTWPDAASFLAAAGPFLREAPLVNQMPLGLANTLVADPLRYGAAARLHTVHDGEADDVVGAILQTPPHVPGLSRMSPEVAAFAGARFVAEHGGVNGAFGVDGEVEAFLDAALASRPSRPALDTERMGLFELLAVADVPRPAGYRRAADPGDADLLQRWFEAFHAEAVPHDPPVEAGAGARGASRGTGHLWVDADGTAVCYAAFNRVVEGFVSVGPVYTPPERRGHGYATGLVAEMSALALAQGRRGCTLFTDLANPTSNRIYERIGYRRIGTMNRYFVRPA